MASPYLDRAKDTRKRLDSCWDLDLAWDKYPEVLKRYAAYSFPVMTLYIYNYTMAWLKY